MMMLPNLIIGGTNKAGTSSVFRYLSDHPEVCGSKVKETGFFVQEPSADRDQARMALSEYFAHCSRQKKVLVEASTSYLALGKEVIPRIKAILGEPRLLFILRNPIDRIYSYFNFHSGQLAIPGSVSFVDFLGFCQQYDSGEMSAEQALFDEWHLKALSFGKYSDFLGRYLSAFSEGTIKVMFFDDLKRDPKYFMREASEYAGIDPAFYENYGFEKTNVTFSSRNKRLHKLALRLNQKMEQLLRQRPRIKSRLVSLYKSVNLGRQGYDEMLPEAKLLLQEYYADSNRELERIINSPLPEGWL